MALLPLTVRNTAVGPGLPEWPEQRPSRWAVGRQDWQHFHSGVGPAPMQQVQDSAELLQRPRARPDIAQNVPAPAHPMWLRAGHRADTRGPTLPSQSFCTLAPPRPRVFLHECPRSPSSPVLCSPARPWRHQFFTGICAKGILSKGAGEPMKAVT